MGGKHFLCGVVLLLGLITGCTKQAKSTFADDAYYHGKYPYRVDYQNAEEKQLLGPDWRLDNFVIDNKGRIKGQKEGGRYRTAQAFDHDGDGEIDEREKDIPAFDLLFTHRKKDAEIWVTTEPLSAKLSEKELRVLLNSYVEAASGSTSRAVTIGVSSIYGHATATAVEEKRFATRIISTSEAKLSGVDALAATFEIANVDQLRLSPDARWERRRIIILRPDFELHRVWGNPVFRKKDDKSKPKTVPYRVLMTVGYSNQTEDFEELLPDLQKLLNSIHLLDDEHAKAFLGQRLAPCVTEGRATLDIHIANTGEVEKVLVADGDVNRSCLKDNQEGYVFPATGESRKLRLSVPLEVLPEGPAGYAEEPAEVVAAPEDEGATEESESQDTQDDTTEGEAAEDDTAQDDAAEGEAAENSDGSSSEEEEDDPETEEADPGNAPDEGQTDDGEEAEEPSKQTGGEG